MAYYVDLGGGDPQSVLAGRISEVAAEQNKPVVASVLGGDGRRVERQGDSVPTSASPRPARVLCARSSGGSGRPGRWGSGRSSMASTPKLLGPRVAAWLNDHPAVGTQEDGGWLPTAESQALLATHGIPFVASGSCPDVERAVSSAAVLGGPVVLKADFPPPAHAADVDAVLLGLEGEAAVRAGWQELEGRRCRGGRS